MGGVAYPSIMGIVGGVGQSHFGPDAPLCSVPIIPCKGGGATQPPTAVAVVLDTSLSMGAQDGDASRLDAAIQLLQEVPWPSSMMVGLGRFEGTWEWHVPLSRDRDYFKMALTTLHAGQLPLSGSHLKSGIEVGLDMLEQWSGPKRVVLISDGGDGAGISFLLRVAQRQGIPIDTIGIGGSRPVSIPNPYSPTPSRLLQPSGELAMTRLQPEYLKEIAKMTGGTYYQNPRRFPLRRLSLPTPGSPNQTDNRWVWVTLGILLVGVGWVNSVYGSRS